MPLATNHHDAHQHDFSLPMMSEEVFCEMHAKLDRPSTLNRLQLKGGCLGMDYSTMYKMVSDGSSRADF